MEKDIKKAAERELKRMEKVFAALKKKEYKEAKEFHEFAFNYYSDGMYFLGKKQYIAAFEAAVIAWAYIDCGIKMGFFSVPAELKKLFTA